MLSRAVLALSMALNALLVACVGGSTRGYGPVGDFGTTQAKASCERPVDFFVNNRSWDRVVLRGSNGRRIGDVEAMQDERIYDCQAGLRRDGTITVDPFGGGEEYTIRYNGGTLYPGSVVEVMIENFNARSYANILRDD